MITFTATDEEAGERVDAILARKAGVTRTVAQRAIRSGDVRVGGSAVRASYRLEMGDVVDANVSVPVDELPQPEAIPVDVRYSDDRVMVVSKPPGLVTHPARGHTSGTLVNALLALGEPLSGTASIRPGIVHRLDKDTSGLLLIAKDDVTQAFLVDALRERRIERRYLALVRGHLGAPSGTIEAPVGRHPAKRWLMAVVGGGRPSITHYEVVGRAGKASLVDLKLETGRTHQIRVHMAHIGHPILGDKSYGGWSEMSRDLGLTRPFLHAWRLTWPRPDGAGDVTVTDRLAADLRAALDAAGLELPDHLQGG